MRRASPWFALFGVAILAGAIAVVVLNATLFSAGGFVRTYLDALARGDAASALGLPGVSPDAAASDALLDDDVLTGLGDLRQLDDLETAAGVHLVTFAWTSPQGEGTTTFAVERIGTRFGLFPEWGFRESPTAVVDLAVLHDPRFTANDLAHDTGLASGGRAAYAVLVPGSYVLGHESSYLVADTVSVLAQESGERIEAAVDVQPGPRLLEQVSREITDHLDACVTQEVLFPTGCPMGYRIADRVVSAPSWSMVEYPVVTVVASTEFGRWEVPRSPGLAHLAVDVQSLFDGSISTFDEDVAFDIHYLVEITSDTTLAIVRRD